MLGIEEFTRIVVRKMQELGHEVVLENPQTNNIFPCGVVKEPLKTVTRVENQTPIEARLSITVEWWSDKKYKSLELNDLADIKLMELNLVRVGSPIDLFDDITKKYRYGGNYEVRYNGLNNSFDRVR